MPQHWWASGARTEETAGNADVSGFQPQVVVEVRPGTVAPLALAVREPSDTEQVRAPKESHTVVKVEALTCSQLLFDVAEPGGADS